MNKITGLIGVQIQGNVIKEYKTSASIKIDEDGVVSAIAMDGLIFTPAPNQPKQKDWEIVSFIDKIGVELNWSENNAMSRKVWISGCTTHGYNIYSVNRLPDNTIFTINDKFTADAGQELTIKGFEVAGGIMKVFSKEHGYWHLSDIKKVLKNSFLFTSEDGVKIYALDDCFEVTSDFKIYLVSFGAKASPNPKCKYFSTEEIAKEYASKNKPCISFTDVVNVMTQSGNEHFPFFPQLYDLAKERVDGK